MRSKRTLLHGVKAEPAAAIIDDHLQVIRGITRSLAVKSARTLLGLAADEQHAVLLAEELDASLVTLLPELRGPIGQLQTSETYSSITTLHLLDTYVNAYLASSGSMKRGFLHNALVRSFHPARYGQPGQRTAFDALATLSDGELCALLWVDGNRQRRGAGRDPARDTSALGVGRERDAMGPHARTGRDLEGLRERGLVYLERVHTSARPGVRARIADLYVPTDAGVDVAALAKAPRSTDEMAPDGTPEPAEAPASPGLLHRQAIAVLCTLSYAECRALSWIARTQEREATLDPERETSHLGHSRVRSLMKESSPAWRDVARLIESGLVYVDATVDAEGSERSGLETLYPTELGEEVSARLRQLPRWTPARGQDARADRSRARLCS